MAHLTKPKAYDIKDSNIALLGSDLEKHVREKAGDSDSAWEGAGTEPGLKVWRIENFSVVEWPKNRFGTFYDGDSYIVLHTFRKRPQVDVLSYDLHFWLGAATTQDEAGTAAYKTVELDDHLHGQPIQYREVQGRESTRFLSYFPKLICLRGGVATGFQHISSPPPLNLCKLYRVSFSPVTGTTSLAVREVVPDASSLVAGDVYILDKGTKLWQFNTKASSGKEKFKAAEFVQNLANERQGDCEVVVYDEGGPGAGAFLAEFGKDVTLRKSEAIDRPDVQPILFRISDAKGTTVFEVAGPPSRSSLDTADTFLLDSSFDATQPAIYVWLGKGASLNERRLVIQYAQQYLYNKRERVGDVSHFQVDIPIIKMNEGNESDEFLEAMGA